MQLLLELPQQNQAFLDQSGFVAKGYDQSIWESEGGQYFL